jgi:polyhydroxybutyrate depolymerase
MLTWIVTVGLLGLFALGFVGAWSAGVFRPRRVERQVMIDQLDRRYIVWLPVSSRGKGPFPVVLAFHGGYGMAEGLEERAALHTAPEADGYVIVYPEGYQRSWNAGACCGPAMRNNIDEVKFVHAILDDLESLVSIDRRRIYATGFSNGAMLCYFLACTMSDEIAAIAPVAGAMQRPLSDEWRPNRPVPVFHLHGISDRWSPYDGGPSLAAAAPIQPPVEQGIGFWRRVDDAWTEEREEFLGSDAECTVYSGADAKVRLCRIAGLGHHWPGTTITGKYKEIAHLFGPLGPAFVRDDVNSAILNFLGAYALPQAHFTRVQVSADGFRTGPEVRTP